MFQPFNLAGIGIGNGWISPEHQVEHADLLFTLGLINEMGYKQLLEYENSTLTSLELGLYSFALTSWLEEMMAIRKLLVSINFYDVTRSHVDLSQKNIWHFLQLPHIRKAIHVGNTLFDNGANVS